MFQRPTLRLFLCGIATTFLPLQVNAQDVDPVSVSVRVENVAPDSGVAITPVWAGFHSGSFDSYNGGLLSLEGLERISEDGDTSLITEQFNDFDKELGGYSYIGTDGNSAISALVRTGDLTDVFRQDTHHRLGSLGAWRCGVSRLHAAKRWFERLLLLRIDGIANQRLLYRQRQPGCTRHFIHSG